MKLAFITDQHFGVRNDSDDFYKNQMLFYNNIFFPYLEENCINTVINFGDITDRRKYVNFKTLNKMRTEYIMKLANMGITQHNVVGNHDTFYKDTNSVNSLNELFQAVPNFHIYSEPCHVNFDGLEVAIMPWINHENFEACREFIKTSTAKVLFGHLELKGFEMYRGSVMNEGYDWRMFTSYEEVYSGHYHHKSSNYNIHYLGASSEYTWSDYADDRGFHVYDTDTRTIEYIKNPYKMFHKIYYDDSAIDNPFKRKKLTDMIKASKTKYTGCYVRIVVNTKNDPTLFDEILDILNSANPVDISVVDKVVDIASAELEEQEEVDMAEDTLTILHKSISAMSFDEEDKSEVKKILTGLYEEAMMETHDNG